MSLKAKPLVIKIGTGVLTHEQNASLDGANIVGLVGAIAQLHKLGYAIILVSSGAVGSGASLLGMQEYPGDLAARQACAAIGQARLVNTYESLFAHFGLHVAQLLLTADDIKNRSEHILNTLNWLLAHGNIIPIINENDSVAIEELKIGDNDMLSVHVAMLVDAQQLVLLTSVDGLYADSKQRDDIIHEVRGMSQLSGFKTEGSNKFSIGGMQSKLAAVRIAIEHGIATSIANGKNPANLVAVVEGSGRATRFIV